MKVLIVTFAFPPANVIGAVCNDVSEAMQDYYYYSYPQYYGPAQGARAKV